MQERRRGVKVSSWTRMLASLALVSAGACAEQGTGAGSVSETATSTAAISDSGVLLRGDGTVLQARGEEVLSYAWQESRDASGRPEPEADERVA
jgi:hypothetical protein